MFYTYSHSAPNGKVFYIGKGKGDRAFSFNDRSNDWKRAIKKNNGVSSTTAFEGYNGSAWAGVGGASGGGGNPFVYENDQTVTVDYTLTSGKNGMTAGPISIASGVTVTIPSGSVWTII